MDVESAAGIERTEGTMPGVSVRRMARATPRRVTTRGMRFSTTP
jgi:hypothetical protein